MQGIYIIIMFFLNRLILSRLVLYHTGLEVTKGEKDILENEHSEYEEKKTTAKERINMLEEELENAKNELNSLIEDDNKVCETLEETIESVNKQEYQLNTYLLNSIFTLLGDEILFNLEPSDILNLYIFFSFFFILFFLLYCVEVQVVIYYYLSLENMNFGKVISTQCQVK